MRLRSRGNILVLVGAAALLLLAIFVFRLGRAEPAMRVGTGIGDRAPTLAVVTTEGKTVRSQDLRGRIVVLSSSAAWCQTCALEAEQLAAVYREVETRDVAFLTVDIDPQDSPDAINEFRTRMQTPWAYAATNGAAQLIRDYGLSRFEITYVIDREGVVRYRDSSITAAADLREVVQGLLHGAPSVQNES